MQNSLFDSAPFVSHSPTSVAAAEAIEPISGTQRRLVLTLIQLSGERGMTDNELQDESGIAGSAQRPRRIELVKAGLVKDSGRTRATKSGRQAVVWIGKEFA